MGVSYAMCTYGRLWFRRTARRTESQTQHFIRHFLRRNRFDDRLDECCADVGVFGFTDDLSLPGELDAVGAWRFRVLSQRYQQEAPRSSRTLEPFRWSLLTRVKQVLLTMGSINTWAS